MFTVVLRIQYQPRRRSDHRTATRGLRARRDSSCRGKYLFKKHGAAAGGARSGILSFSRAGWRYMAPWWLPRRKNRGSGGGGIKTRSVFPDAGPRRRFAYFADAGKVGRPAGRNHPHPPAGEIPTSPSAACQSRAGGSYPPLRVSRHKTGASIVPIFPHKPPAHRPKPLRR